MKRRKTLPRVAIICPTVALFNAYVAEHASSLEGWEPIHIGASQQISGKYHDMRYARQYQLVHEQTVKAVKRRLHDTGISAKHS